MSERAKSIIRRQPAPRQSFAGFRRYGRRDVRTNVMVQDSDGWEIPLESVNVSPTGIFIESPLLFELGSVHTLIFRTSDGGIVRVAGRVVRVDRGFDERGVEVDERPGMAYEFVETDDHTWNSLCAMVAGV
jgi:hypothetical protein